MKISQLILLFSILEIRKLSKVPTLNMEHICVKEEKRYIAFGTGYTTCSILGTDTWLYLYRPYLQT